ncbi:Putative transmembrane anti-sigma factor OS=Tsukamurella paurometabola (strain ATCC 8368 / DSM/ CCUG 35730 / CIP 100753 / JCM 10117 / KCTC 9821 / NBRC 16120 / NCIMB 702349 / NCTC 13040) OX=521096 GN=Tpau_3771 PE=4 SV=1 [Tsukamurella paurometabola]|uniref:Putative transmembrane anti-sigma factor n=1 Tax=Tsukamurella paurometabola (strain ATCC 8368 / DSM 20162 / CCUG 35730 / CIP 100753 / JCM 10117 / KCTC 9821 / NBRC 16120 / NCIMB 702349 / NCTC 13040) TaxID=521096 RepID=D5UYP6_TSUPD|nr:zf-HC2 domain-containing protein [Tsukamurella paurometabola]ADG80349.1 putative transmembrane anti-sigma factor [Tsukamurella paurometabola DSM 20162]SUP39325.1 Predicted transmembrane transcriptional regulator (anti-sigma factor) [Tsukamurella paurometabola]
MHCARWRGALSAELDGELDAAERAGLVRHLGACPACAVWLEENRRIGRRLALRSVEPAEDLHARLLPLVDLRTICGCGDVCRCEPECTCGDLCACRAAH